MLSPGRQSSPSSRALRGKRLRVTTGCLTCRKRHVKCDERRPSCANCGKKNRQCRWDTPGQPAPPAEETLSPRLQLTPSETSETPAAKPARRVNEEESNNVEAVAPSPAAPSPASTTLGSVLLGTEQQNTQTAGSSRFWNAALNLPESLSEPEAFTGGLHVESQIQLTGPEILIFRNFVDNVSRWIDSFSHDQPFHRRVPILALKCPVLLHACLALSAKQMHLIGKISTLGFDERDAVRYYRLALSAIRSMLLRPECAHSDELLAACTILSTYEMINVVGDSLGSHLTGVASLLQSRQVHGDVRGIRGCCYWTWLRHELWAAIQTGRRMSLDENYWEPEPLASFDHLLPEDIANRVIFIFGQCINFCNDDQAAACGAEGWLQSREAKADELERGLDEWKTKLPPSMTSFSSIGPDDPNGFPAMWFVFPQSAVAHLVFHASKILLALHQTPNTPKARGLANCAFLSLRSRIEASRREIFLTANSHIPGSWGLLSTQCLYIAGLVTEGEPERRRTLELIDLCQKTTGRKTGFLGDDLRRIWAQEQGS